MYAIANGFTKQGLIDKINKEFKGKAFNGSGCDYLTEDGKKCVVGLFIPDGHRGQKCSNGVYTLLDNYADLRALMPLDTRGMSDWQGVHDGLNVESAVELQKQALINWVNQNVA